MINWNYNADDFKTNQNALIPEGDHRVIINSVKVKTYSSGNEGFEIMLDVSSYSGKLWHRIIMDPNNPEKTNHHLGKFFESFGITNYDLNCYDEWVGKDGAVRVKHDSYNGLISAKVIFCITRAYQAKLPIWKDPVSYENARQKSASSYSFNSTPVMPNKHTQTASPPRQINFDGFSF